MYPLHINTRQRVVEITNNQAKSIIMSIHLKYRDRDLHSNSDHWRMTAERYSESPGLMLPLPHVLLYALAVERWGPAKPALPSVSLQKLGAPIRRVSKWKESQSRIEVACTRCKNTSLHTGRRFSDTLLSLSNDERQDTLWTAVLHLPSSTKKSQGTKCC